MGRPRGRADTKIHSSPVVAGRHPLRLPRARAKVTCDRTLAGNVFRVRSLTTTALVRLLRPRTAKENTVAGTGELAERFVTTNRELQTLVDALSEAQWRRPCADTGWPVGVTVHHVAESLGTLTGLVQALASGAKIPEITGAALDAGNAEHAARAANVTHSETAKLLRDNVIAGEAVIRGLTDGQMKATTLLPMGEMTAEQIIEGILIGHTGMHIDGIRAAGG